MRFHSLVALLALPCAVGCGGDDSSTPVTAAGGGNGGPAGSTAGGAAGSKAGGGQGGAGSGQGGAGQAQGGAGQSQGGAGQAQGGAGAEQGGAGSAQGGAGAGPTGPTAATQASGNFFPDGAIWNQDISQAKTSPESDAITQWMVGYKPPAGFGTGHFQVDFSIVALEVPAGTAKHGFTENDAYSSPDCDTASVPLPAGGILEGTVGVAATSSFAGYECAGFGDYDDCHLLLHAPGENRLYEIYRASVPGGDLGQFTGGCLAIWDTSKVYDSNGRGQQCTSADAAGFPISPLLFTAEELKAGVINHAIRFILPNDMIRAKKYVAPATHGTKTTGPMTSIPYGARLRLRADFPVDTLSPAAQVVARALQKYGMFHADGGNIALTAQSDALGSVKYADLGFDSHSLYAINATDFEVLDFDTPVDVTFDCQRTPITEP
jgi:serine/threonine-protein kinase